MSDPARPIRLYCFDFDDTIATTDVRVWTVNGPVSTASFALQKTPNLSTSDPFREFDNIDGCVLSAAPCTHKFREALLLRQPIAIVTARANDPQQFRRLVERAALELCGVAALPGLVHIYCCNWPGWSLGGASRQERKCRAVIDFLYRYPQAISVGFSDDDVSNLDVMEQLFERFRSECPQVKFRTYSAAPASPSPPPPPPLLSVAAADTALSREAS